MDLTDRPYGLLAELTYHCPLHCPYCSNPTRWEKQFELDTLEWEKAIQEAAELGVLQVGFSGGEPLQRKDLELLVQIARKAGLYTNLITSGLGLTENRATRLLGAARLRHRPSCELEPGRNSAMESYLRWRKAVCSV